MTIRHRIGVAAAVFATFTSQLAISQIAITGEPTRSGRTEAASTETISISPTRSRRDAAGLLADAAQRYEQAVGVVVATAPGKAPDPIGTAWAFGDGLFATNAHVAAGLSDFMDQHPGAVFHVAINRRPDLRLQVTGVSAHPDYGKRAVRFDGRTAGSGYDLAILRTDGTAPVVFPLADEATLRSLRAGDAIGYLGFPMEQLNGDNLDANMPIATMQTGIVSAISDHFLADSGFENNRLVRHNLPATGGASGSPIFTADGKVVAILYGINVNVDAGIDLKTRESRLSRQPSAAQVNFAERIDGLADVPVP